MTTHLMAKSTLAPLVGALMTLVALPTWAQYPQYQDQYQSPPVPAAQVQAADDVAKKGVPLSELAAKAPDKHVVQPGDTLWAISGMFLKSPWRWPELWGMNREEIKNPHLIYPGQILLLDRKDGMARLRLGQPVGSGEPLDVRVSPRTRYAVLTESTVLPTLRPSLIEPFLAEPLIVDEDGLRQAPRIVAAQEGRVMLTQGDRAYARGPHDAPLLDDQAREKTFRIFREAIPLKDPVTGEVLGYEAQYVGKALLVRSESTTEVEERDGSKRTALVPATIDIVQAKEEMRVGDRLLPEPERVLRVYTPRSPAARVDGRVVSIYGSASMANAGQNQAVVINRGSKDGMELGMVLAILKDGARLTDKTDDARQMIKLPDERNGLLMVFRTFERLSYALVLEITDGVRVGDRLTNPR